MNAVALWNMLVKSVTLLTFQLDKLLLNLSLLANMLFIEVTFAVFQLFSDWLNESAL